jgi:thiamine biosynthesis lipoprotein
VLTSVPEGFAWTFSAMASTCEVRMETADAALAERLGRVGEAEARRIEAKFSRYDPASVLSAINRSGGEAVHVDEETAGLLAYAGECHRLSGGRFDVTSGVLRRIWRFDGSDKVPGESEVAAVLPLIGWEKVGWLWPTIVLPPGMEIDFGGLGKEYAVDRALLAIQAESDAPALVNFGGDLRTSGPRLDGGVWPVAIESVDAFGRSEAFLGLSAGALATSGDARRFLIKDGVRYGHILNPLTGYPVRDPPRSVTVAAPTCLEAGLMATLAMLHGAGAGDFLAGEGAQAWITP